MGILNSPLTFAILFPTVIAAWLCSRLGSKRDRLSQYSGPWIAPWAGQWYRAYYDVVKSGGFLDQMTKLHMRYGPVVRIGPNELHFNSPEAFFDIYSFQNLTKEPSLYNSFHFHESSISFLDKSQSTKRRDALGPLFSRSAIIRFEWDIREKVDKFIHKMVSYGETPLDFHMGVRSATLDIIGKYCFADDFAALDFPKFRHPILVSLQEVVTSCWIIKYLPWMHTVMDNIPNRIIDLLPEEKQFPRNLRTYASDQIDRHVETPGAFDLDHPTVYDYLLNQKGDTPSRASLVGETMALVAAGHDTVGGAATVGCYHVLSNPHIRRKLESELEQAWPDMHSEVTFQTLEKLPYLTAVIKEALRMSHGVVSSLPRVTGEDLRIAGCLVPKDTIVSMSATFIHLNDKIFESPYEFRPERWLEENSKDINNYLVSFSRGARRCLGTNLAWCELYTFFAHIFRKLDLKIHNPQEGDYKTFRDFFLPIWNGNRLHVVARFKTDA